MASSLDSLLSNIDEHPNLSQYFKDVQLTLLKQKGIYPYDYMDSISKLDEPKLPPIEAFYSKLNDAGISNKEYQHAQKVWNTFECKTMRDYHNLYNLADVLQLADIFENFRDVCMKHYKLDPL